MGFSLMAVCEGMPIFKFVTDHCSSCSPQLRVAERVPFVAIPLLVGLPTLIVKSTQAYSSIPKKIVDVKNYHNY